MNKKWIVVLIGSLFAAGVACAQEVAYDKVTVSNSTVIDNEGVKLPGVWIAPTGTVLLEDTTGFGVTLLNYNNLNIGYLDNEVLVSSDDVELSIRNDEGNIENHSLLQTSRLAKETSQTVENFSTQIEANTAGIATNAAAIESNTAGIAANAAAIESNTADIATNAAAIKETNKRTGTIAVSQEGGRTTTTVSGDSVVFGNNAKQSVRIEGGNVCSTGDIFNGNGHSIEGNRAAIKDVDSRLSGVESRLSDVKRTAYRGIAAVTAIADIPTVDYNKRFAIGVGMGNVEGENALAIGASLRATESLTFKASVGKSGSEATYGAGAALSF